ncbi:cytochrome P450 [Patellaria atrata CBS 101060]|uniref:Cytochrome P450 n=1 Tax=Patellaria atrata CBS 101060 TaxID=1346257 RepID=A0A9P4S7A7_9PEZI|nr:cytochrome P450 [Patellaria atrata CBS 101060]
MDFPSSIDVNLPLGRFPSLWSTWLDLNDNVRAILGIGCLILIPIIMNYAIAWAMYHWQHWNVDEQQIPPEYPSFIPYIGNIIPFIFDGKNFVQRVTSYAGRVTSTRLNVLGQEIYIFQEPETLAALWKSPVLSSPIQSYVFALKYICGMQEKALSPYRADDSGSYPKPFPGTQVEPHNRVDYIIHQGVQRGLVGPGLVPTTRRLTKAVTRKIEHLQVSKEWTVIPDLSRFMYDIVGVSIIESICGPSLMSINPAFADDFWTYDKNVPWLSRGIPSFVIPNAYRVRDRLIDQLKNWHSFAKSHFTESDIEDDGDSDRFWGSEMMRSRQKTLRRVDDQDNDSIASSDLGLIWASVSNILGASTLATAHVFKDRNLLSRVREIARNHSEDQGEHTELELKQLQKDPLLSSVYAEVLRLYSKAFMIAKSPHVDVSLGRWWFPKDTMGLANSHVSHMNDNFWNTKCGLYPIDTFWADRFVQDPRDPSSGPMRPEFQGKERKAHNEPFFSLKGLEGAWIPYGGGHKQCPGRFLAKAVVISTCILLSQRFDIEMLTESMEMSPWKFGLGVLRPKTELPFRIRRRMS